MADFITVGGHPGSLRLTLKLVDSDRRHIDSDAPRDIPAERVEFLRPSISNLPDAELNMIGYSSGHPSPALMTPFPRDASEADRLDTRAVCLCGADSGPGDPTHAHWTVLQEPDWPEVDRPTRRRNTDPCLPDLPDPAAVTHALTGSATLRESGARPGAHSGRAFVATARPRSQSPETPSPA